MKHKIIIMLLCFVAVNVNARQLITGNLTDKETTKPVEGANVELLQLPDSGAVETSKTNSEGLFIFYKADTVKTYCLRVKSLIYKTVLLSVVPKKKSMINNVGTLTMEPNTFNLKDIVVNGSKVSVTELGDRTIYGIPDGIKKTSTDGLDVLRKVPSVQVDYLNEDITVNGKSNIKIEVDGVTRDKNYLKRLHPSQISKMEVITSPSGKYDADVDAVINVVTNPAMRFGLKGMATVAAIPISSDSYLGMVNGSLDYGLEKVSYYVAANAVGQNIDLNSDMNRVAGTSETQQNSSQINKVAGSNVNLGLIYDPDELNNLNLNVSYNNYTTKYNNDTWNYSSSDNISSIYKTVSNYKGNSGGLTSSLFYKHKFDKKTQHGLEAELNYFNNLNNKSTTNFQNINYSSIDTSELYSSVWQKEHTETKVQRLSGQTNYTLPFDSVYSFNVGVNANYNLYNTDNTSSLLEEASNMDYSDLRIGAYAELSKTFKKGSIKIGSRFETSRVVINSSDPHHYSSPLPYVNGFFRINGDNSIKLAYSRRVIRPSSSQLNPFESVVDSQTVSHGNMDLKPAYRDNFQLTYSLKLTKKKVTVNLSPQLFYEYKTNLIQNIVSLNSTTNIFESVPTNISNGYEGGGGLSVNSQIGKFLFNADFRYSFNHIDKYLDQIEATNQQSWRCNSYVMCPLPLNLQFMSLLNISGPVLNGQTETKTSPFYMAGLIKQFKNNSSIYFFALNPFASKFSDNTTTIRNSSIYQKQNYSIKQTSGLMLEYVYQFKVGKSIEKQKHNVEQQMQDNVIKLPSF
jgi:hypothetical protein